MKVAYGAPASELMGCNSAGSKASTSSRLDQQLDDIKLVCMDMDGTLLDSESNVSYQTAKVIRQCMAWSDVTLMVATGKARPAAIAALSDVGLAGELHLLLLALHHCHNFARPVFPALQPSCMMITSFSHDGRATSAVDAWATLPCVSV